MIKLGREARLVLLIDNDGDVAGSLIIWGNNKTVFKKMMAWREKKVIVSGYRECYGTNMGTHISRCYVNDYGELPSIDEIDGISHFAINRIPHYIVGTCGSTCGVQLTNRQDFLQ